MSPAAFENVVLIVAGALIFGSGYVAGWKDKGWWK